MGLSEEAKAETGGTRLYMAPELVEGKAATLQSDLFALGVMLYQAVQGDFSRALAPGWWRDVDDELLREDIAEAVEGVPERRLGDARELARRLRSLGERRERRESERQLRAEALQVQEALERSRWRRKLGAAIIGALTIVIAGMGLLASQIAREKERTEREAARARNIARVAVAGEWLREDPTRAALVLLEVEQPDQTPYAVAQMRRVLQQKLATVTLRGHEGPIQSASWSPRGDRIVTASRDRTIRVWHADGSGVPVVIALPAPPLAAWFDPRREGVVTFSSQGMAQAWGYDGSGGAVIFDTRDSNVQAVAMSPRGDRVVTGSWSGRVGLWVIDGSAIDGFGEVTLSGHDGPVTAAAFSPAGDLVVTGSQDGTARVWSIDGVREPTVFEHGHPVLSVMFGPQGDRVLTVSAEGVASVWKVGSSGEPVVFEVALDSLATIAAAWSPSGRRVALAWREGAWILNADGGGDAVELKGHSGDVTVSFSPSGERVLTASGDGTAKVWNADGSGEPVVLRGHRAGVRAAFDPVGERVLTFSRGGTARVWEVGPETEPAVLRHAGAVRIAAWSPLGDRLATASEDGTVQVWSANGLPELEPVALEGHATAVEVVAWNPLGDRLLTGSRAGAIRVWAVDGASAPVDLRGLSGRPLSVAWSRAGDRVLIGSEDGMARVWRADGGTPVVFGPHAGPVVGVAWSSDDDGVVTVAAHGTEVLLWPGVNTDHPEVLLNHDAAIETVAFSPSGDRVVTVAEGGLARAWSLGGFSVPGWSASHEDFVFAATFSTRGDLLTATSEGVVRVFTGESTKPWIVRGHQSAIHAASWSPEGERFVTASADGTARIWKADGASEPKVLAGHTGQIMDVSWSPRGDRIATVSLDGTARVWRVETSDLVSAIAAATSVCLTPDFRRHALGDSPESALASYDDCERARGRTPRVNHDRGWREDTR